MQSKKIIFIAGADHSGSTLTGAILGADEILYRYFHVGEVYAFFCENKKQFGKVMAARRKAGGRIWDKIDHTVGYENAYREIFDKTNAKVIIDSSKTPENFEICKKACAENQYSIHVVLTFRPFAKIWSSDSKRDKEEKQIIRNINRYFNFKKMVIEQGFEYSIINIENLIMNPSGVTRALCNAVGIPYFKGKENYWNYPGCHLYGSQTQRRHFNKPETAGFNAKKIMNPPNILIPYLENRRIRVMEEFLKANTLITV